MTPRLTPGVSREVVGDTVSSSVAEAMGQVPRHLFLPVERRMTAYLDRSVPLGRGRRCPRPSEVARMLDACSKVGGRALVVGAGSGYVAACVAETAREVVAVESDEDLLALAATALGTTSRGRAITLRHALPAQAALEAQPYDVIVVCGAVDRTPRRLLGALTETGTLVVPIRADRRCSLFSFQRAQRGHLRRDHGSFEVEPLPAAEAEAC